MTAEENAVFSKAIKNKPLDYLFYVEQVRNDSILNSKSYNGQNLIRTFTNDSSYEIGNINKDLTFRSTMLGNLRWLQDFLKKNPTKITLGNDTTINSTESHRLIFNTYDTLVGNQHLYSRIHLFINKASNIPNCIIFKSINKEIADVISNNHTEYFYSNFKFNQNNIDIASKLIPSGFVMRDKNELPLLATGMAAPNWTLYSTDNEKMSLSQATGKVVLLDFSLINCGACLLALKPMNNLHEKYKNKNVLIASIYLEDLESLKKFVKKYNIKYPVYINGNDVSKLYQIPTFPSFYIIDKNGKIAHAFSSHFEGLEEQLTTMIDNLLNKN